MKKKRFSGGKAQVSMEYLLLFLFVTMLLSVASYLIYDYYKSYDRSVTISRADTIANEIMITAEKIHYFSAPSKITLTAEMPEGINSIGIYTNNPATGCTKCTELRFGVSYEGGSDVISSTKVPVRGCDGYDGGTGNTIFPERYFSRGRKEFTITAMEDNEDYVEICLND